MSKLRVTAMRITDGTYAEIMKEHGKHLGDAAYRSMLVSLKPGCYVETVDGRGGDIVEIKRDRNDIPIQVRTVCKVVDEKTDETIDEHHDEINVEDIFFWEAWDFIAPQYLFEDENAVIGELMFASEVM